MIKKEDYIKAKEIVAEYEKQLNISINNGSFTPNIGDTVEVIYSDDNFEKGELVTVLEQHPQDGFWVVGNDNQDTYNDSLHISDIKEIK